MKLLGKIALIALATEVFRKYPEEQQLFAREDGNIFFSENYAQLGRGKMKIYPVERIEFADQIAAEIEVKGETILSPVSPETAAPATDPPAADAPSTDAPATEAPVKPAADPKAALKANAATPKTTGKGGKNPEHRTIKNTEK